MCLQVLEQQVDYDFKAFLVENWFGDSDADIAIRICAITLHFKNE